MAGTTTALVGKDVSILIDGIEVGCATDISLDVSVEMIPTTCAADAGWKSQKPGEKSGSGSISGVMRNTTGDDIATNITHAEFFAKLNAGTLCTFVFTAEHASGIGITYSFSGYMSGLQLQAAPTGSGEATFTANIAVSGAISIATYD